MSIMNEINYRDLFNTTSLPVLDLIMLDEYKRLPDVRSKLFNMEKMDREIAQNTMLNSLGRFQVTQAAEDAPLDSISQSYNKTYKAVKFTKRIAITKEMIRDEQYGLIDKLIRSIGKAAAETKAVNAAAVFNGAFSASLTPSADGVALISASHPSLIGNQSNTLAAQSDLAEASLKEAERVFRKTKDQVGNQLDLMPSVLLVPPDLMHTAAELVQSPFLPGTSNNNINSIGKYDVINWPFLTDIDGWFLMSSPDSHGLRVKTRQELETVSQMHQANGVLEYVADYREAVGADEWRGIVGSDGSAS